MSILWTELSPTVTCPCTEVIDEMEYVLIDTDIGDDIDDAFALSLALHSNELQVVAVTTVFRNTLCRARQTEKLMAVLGMEIPVYAGTGLPMDGTIPSFSHDSALSTQEKLETLPCQYDSSMDAYRSKDNAVDAICAYADKYDGKLTVVLLGAMTNLAQALLKRKDLADKIEKVVCMGGWFTNFQQEWNIICDPVAADIVFRSGVKVYAVGLDVTLQCVLDQHLLDAFRASTDPCNKLIMGWMDRWFDAFHFEKSVMHDPLAVASVYAPVCKFEKQYVRVVKAGEKRGAIEVAQQDGEGFSPIYVAAFVDRERFYSLIREKLLDTGKS